MITLLLQFPFLSIISRACLVTIFIFVFLRLSKKCRGKSINYLYVFILTFYSLLLISILFYPSVRYSNENIDINYFQLVPFKSISGFISNGIYMQILAGIIVTVPIAPLLYLNFKKVSIHKLSLITLVIVLLIEPVQLIINIITNYPNRIIDIDDFILNSIGWGISICLVMLWKKYLNRIRKKQLL